MRFGLIKIKTPFSEIDGFTLFSRSEKLVIYLKNGGYSVIVIDKRRYDEFFAEVKKFDGKLTYLTRTEEKEN